MADKLAPDYIAAGGGANTWTPQLTNNFYIQVADIPTLTQGRELYLAVEGGGIPSSSFEEVTIDFVNMQVFMAGALRFENFAMRIRDFVDAQSRNAAFAWYNQVGDPRTGLVNLPRIYKKDVKMVLFAPDGTLEREWLCEGCWPQAQSWGELSYTTVENLMIEFTLRCDRAYLVGGGA